MKLALPKGRLLSETATLFQQAGLTIDGYDSESRSYRPVCPELPELFVKVFNEKDVPIQVAVGNYDLGICGGAWVSELLSKYPSSALLRIKDLGYGDSEVYVASCAGYGLDSVADLQSCRDILSIATEYPNLAESFALNMRLKRFKVFPVWGAAEAYPPDSASLAILSRGADETVNGGLKPLTNILNSTACVIAHRDSWEKRDLSPVLERLFRAASETSPARLPAKFAENRKRTLPITGIRLALPDGHQQGPTLEFLDRAGICLDQHDDTRRPAINIDGVSVKVIRPQDMPLQVANGNFDLAITGQDWLKNHLHQFPSSPVRERLCLGFGKVRIVAVVSKQVPVDSPVELREMLASGTIKTLRIASEYTDIADRYARDRRLSPYKLIPTWGATEAFLPEDADLLIENVQTGKTLEKHNLKIIDTLFESSACVVGRDRPDDALSEKLERVVKLLDRALQE